MNHRIRFQEAEFTSPAKEQNIIESSLKDCGGKDIESGEHKGPPLIWIDLFPKIIGNTVGRGQESVVVLWRHWEFGSYLVIQPPMLAL